MFVLERENDMKTDNYTFRINDCSKEYYQSMSRIVDEATKDGYSFISITTDGGKPLNLVSDQGKIPT